MTDQTNPEFFLIPDELHLRIIKDSRLFLHVEAIERAKSYFRVEADQLVFSLAKVSLFGIEPNNDPTWVMEVTVTTRTVEQHFIEQTQRQKGIVDDLMTERLRDTITEPTRAPAAAEEDRG